MSDFIEPPAINIDGEGQLRCRIQTRLGVIEGILYEAEAPNTVANFVGLATGATTGEPFYNSGVKPQQLNDWSWQTTIKDIGPCFNKRDSTVPIEERR